MVMQSIASDQKNAEVPMNENFESIAHTAVYGKRHPVTTGLTWGYWGGRWAGFAVSDGTLTLSNATNYVVVERATGAISTATTTTNWNDTANYLRVYKITASGGVVTAAEDHRAGPGGVHGTTPSSSSGAALGANNVFTKSQTVAKSTLTSGTNVSVDASLSNNFRLVLAHNATLDNPTNLVDGLILNFRIKQDATGGRTLGYGSKYKFPGGVAPVLSTAANAVDILSCAYDSTDDTLACNLTKAFS